MKYARVHADGKIAEICVGFQPVDGIEASDVIADCPQDYLYQNGTFVYSPDLTPIRQDKIQALSLACDTVIQGGFTSSALGAAHTYPSDKDAQDYLNDAIKRMELDSTVPSVNFKTLDAGYLAHTLTQLHQVFKDGFDFGQSQITKFNNLKAQVQSATTPDAIGAIVW